MQSDAVVHGIITKRLSKPADKNKWGKSCYQCDRVGHLAKDEACPAQGKSLNKVMEAKACETKYAFVLENAESQAGTLMLDTHGVMLTDIMIDSKPRAIELTWTKTGRYGL